MAGRWFITPHAVERYRERVPGAERLTDEQVLGAIIIDSMRAHMVKRETNGLELWRVGKPHRTRYRVAPATQPGQLPQLVTVLRGCEYGRR